MQDENVAPTNWVTDQIIDVSQGSDFLRHTHAPVFRLNDDIPYLRLQFVSVYVRDQEQSLRFFVDKLGFVMTADVRFASGNRWVEVSPPDGTAALALLVPRAGFDEDRLVGNSGFCSFLAEDVEKTYREWSERGVHFTVPPQTPTWGGTFARFADLDGNPFGLVGFDEATQAIDERRRAYAERLETERLAVQELEIAKQVQARLFPQRLPNVPGLDYAGRCVQARSVGGDYYDFLELLEGRAALIVGDIAGKGIAAALLMANLQATVRSQLLEVPKHPEIFFKSLNQMLFENTAPSSYATLFFAGYDPETCRLLYVNCGHLPGLILRLSGVIDELGSNCPVVGLFKDWQFDISSTELGRGDLLAIYTDGITECCDVHGEEFGQQRLADALARHSSLPARDAVNAVVEEVLEFCEQRPGDDLTLIVARR